MHVLVTRPEPGAGATARCLAALGHIPVLAPLAETAMLPADLPAPGCIQAVVVASARALPALRDFRARPLFAVGDATAGAARRLGFAPVFSARGDGAALARLVVSRCDPAGAPLLLPGQEGQGVALSARLEAAGFAVCPRAVYRLDRLSALPGAARRALEAGAIEAALFFSPASARDFVALAGVLPLACFSRIDSLAISPATAAELAPLPWRRVRIAVAPDQDALLGLLP